jgi:hypothetical protein
LNNGISVYNKDFKLRGKFSSKNFVFSMVLLNECTLILGERCSYIEIVDLESMKLLTKYVLQGLNSFTYVNHIIKSKRKHEYAVLTSKGLYFIEVKAHIKPYDIK